MLLLTDSSMLNPSDTVLFEQIYEKYNKKIYEIANGILKNHHDSEEILNEVFLKIAENIDKFKTQNENEIISQIVIYSRNSAINRYNQNKRRNKLSVHLSYSTDEAEEQEFEMENTDFDLEQSVIDKETTELVQKYLKMPVPGAARYNQTCICIGLLKYRSVGNSAYYSKCSRAANIQRQKENNKTCGR